MSKHPIHTLYVVLAIAVTLGLAACVTGARMNPEMLAQEPAVALSLDKCQQVLDGAWKGAGIRTDGQSFEITMEVRAGRATLTALNATTFTNWTSPVSLHGNVVGLGISYGWREFQCLQGPRGPRLVARYSVNEYMETVVFEKAQQIATAR